MSGRSSSDQPADHADKRALPDFDEYRWGGYGDDLGAPLPPGSLEIRPLLIGLFVISIVIIVGALVLGLKS